MWVKQTQAWILLATFLLLVLLLWVSMEETQISDVLKTQSPIKCVSLLLLRHVRLFETPWTGAHQAPLSIRFPRQQSWSRLSFHSPGDLPGPGVEAAAPAWQAASLLLSHQGSPPMFIHLSKMLWKGQKSTDTWKGPRDHAWVGHDCRSPKIRVLPCRETLILLQTSLAHLWRGGKTAS